MAPSSADPEWTPERYGREVGLLVEALLRIPKGQKLAYFNAEIANFPEPYRTAAETIILQKEALMDNPPPPGPFGFLREAIQAVPAVRYALGVGGVVSLIAVIGSFGINYRVAVIGFPIIIVMMVLLLVFAKLAGAKPQYFLGPLVALAWFSMFATIATVCLIFSSVFFRWPLDLHGWLTTG
jgi:hypothetical protein